MCKVKVIESVPIEMLSSWNKQDICSDGTYASYVNRVYGVPIPLGSGHGGGVFMINFILYSVEAPDHQFSEGGNEKDIKEDVLWHIVQRFFKKNFIGWVIYFQHSRPLQILNSSNRKCSSLLLNKGVAFLRFSILYITPGAFGPECSRHFSFNIVANSDKCVCACVYTVQVHWSTAKFSVFTSIAKI